MRTTQQFSITLPTELATLVKRKVATEGYATDSEVIRDGLRVLLARDQVVHRWLREPPPVAAVSAAEVGRAKPTDAMRLERPAAVSDATLSEQEMGALDPAAFRVAEARYHLQQFGIHCGPPVDSYFQMVVHFDAFLFALVAVEEMLSAEQRKVLRASKPFAFVKALRNVTAHHSVLGVVLPGAKFGRPFYRRISTSLGGTPNDASRLILKPALLHEIFAAMEREPQSNRKLIALARTALAELERAAGEHDLEGILDDALAFVANFLLRSKAV